MSIKIPLLQANSALSNTETQNSSEPAHYLPLRTQSGEQFFIRGLTIAEDCVFGFIDADLQADEVVQAQAFGENTKFLILPAQQVRAIRFDGGQNEQALTPKYSAVSLRQIIGFASTCVLSVKLSGQAEAFYVAATALKGNWISILSPDGHEVALISLGSLERLVIADVENFERLKANGGNLI